MPNNSKSLANVCKTGPFSLMRKLHEPKSFFFLLSLYPKFGNKYYVALNGMASAQEFQ